MQDLWIGIDFYWNWGLDPGSRIENKMVGLLFECLLCFMTLYLCWAHMCKVWKHLILYLDAQMAVGSLMSRFGWYANCIPSLIASSLLDSTHVKGCRRGFLGSWHKNSTVQNAITQPPGGAGRTDHVISGPQFHSVLSSKYCLWSLNSYWVWNQGLKDVCLHLESAQPVRSPRECLLHAPVVNCPDDDDEGELPCQKLGNF